MPRLTTRNSAHTVGLLASSWVKFILQLNDTNTFSLTTAERTLPRIHIYLICPTVLFKQIKTFWLCKSNATGQLVHYVSNIMSIALSKCFYLSYIAYFYSALINPFPILGIRSLGISWYLHLNPTKCYCLNRYRV